MTISAQKRCSNCGGNLFLKDDDGQDYCFLCTRPYNPKSDYGQRGGEEVYKRYGTEHMANIGGKGGRPRLKTAEEIIQQSPAPNGQNNENGGRLSNRLSDLKELWRGKIKQGEAITILRADGVASPWKGGKNV